MATAVDGESRCRLVVGLGIGHVGLGGLREQVIPAERPHLGAGVGGAGAGGGIAERIRLHVLCLEDVVAGGVGTTQHPALALDRRGSRGRAAQVLEVLVHGDGLERAEVVAGTEAIALLRRVAGIGDVVATVRLVGKRRVQRTLGILNTKAVGTPTVVITSGLGRAPVPVVVFVSELYR